MPREFKSPYDFYRLDEAERKSLVNEVFTADERDGILYFPVQLSEEGSYCNYGKRQGVLAVSPIWPNRMKNSPDRMKNSPDRMKNSPVKAWFKVFAFSPDDLDLSLEWHDPTPELREAVLQLVRDMPKDEVAYRECLEFIQLYHGGEISL